MNARRGDDGTDETALSLASGAGYDEVVRLLLDSNADVNAVIIRPLLEADRPGDGESRATTPLYSACASGSVEAAQLLLEAGARVSGEAALGRSTDFCSFFVFFAKKYNKSNFAGI